MFRRVNRIRLWPPRRDDNSGVLIDAGGRRRSDWPVRVFERSMARVQGQVAPSGSRYTVHHKRLAEVRTQDLAIGNPMLSRCASPTRVARDKFWNTLKLSIPPLSLSSMMTWRVL